MGKGEFAAGGLVLTGPKAGKSRGIYAGAGPDKAGNLSYIRLTMAMDMKCVLGLSCGCSAGQDRPGGVHGSS